MHTHTHTMTKKKTSVLSEGAPAARKPEQPKPPATPNPEAQDRRRERNRIAARKCRQRRQEYIDALEQHIRDLTAKLELYQCLHNASEDMTIITHNGLACKWENSRLSATIAMLSSIEPPAAPLQAPQPASEEFKCEEEEQLLLRLHQQFSSSSSSSEDEEPRPQQPSLEDGEQERSWEDEFWILNSEDEYDAPASE